MNGKLLMNAIGEISDRHIIEFAEVKHRHKIYNLPIFKLIPAACLGAIVIASVLFYQSHNSGIQLPEPSNSDVGNNVLQQPSDSSVNSFDPATSDSQAGNTYEPSNPNSTTAEHPTTSGDIGTTEPPPVSQITPGVDSPPNMVYQSKNASYSVAKQQFGHAIKECTAPNFTGYAIGIVSRTGNHDGSEETICVHTTYKFTNGEIIIEDQDRLGGYIYDEFAETIEYKGHIFAIKTYLAEKNQVRYEYYPTQEKGLAYIAEFDKDTDTYEIFDLILSLVV